MGEVDGVTVADGVKLGLVLAEAVVEVDVEGEAVMLAVLDAVGDSDAEALALTLGLGVTGMQVLSCVAAGGGRVSISAGPH